MEPGGFFVGGPLDEGGAEGVDGLLEVVVCVCVGGGRGKGGVMLMLLEEGEGLCVCLGVCIWVGVVAFVVNDQGRATTHV